MGKGSKKAQSSAEDTEHILGILTSLFTSLASESVPRLRLLAKFVEDSYSKVDRLLDLREEAEGRLIATERAIDEEKAVRLLWSCLGYVWRRKTDILPVCLPVRRWPGRACRWMPTTRTCSTSDDSRVASSPSKTSTSSSPGLSWRTMVYVPPQVTGLAARIYC